jgi:hypothetical protein
LLTATGARGLLDATISPRFSDRDFRNKERLMKAIVLLALALVWVSAAYAQTPPASEHAQHMDQLATLLDLNDAQKAQVQTVLQAEHAKMKAAHDEAKASGTQPDWQQMKAMHEQIKQETIQKLTPVLSPAQLKKFETLQDMHGEMMRSHGGHGGHGGPPGGQPPQQN